MIELRIIWSFTKIKEKIYFGVFKCPFEVVYI